MIQITDAQSRHAENVAKQFQLDLLILFGSQVTGQTHAESDYDIGYVGQQPLSLEEEGRLILALMPVLGIRDERLINLVNLRRTKPLLLYGATKNAQVIFEVNPTTFAKLRPHPYKHYP